MCELPPCLFKFLKVRNLGKPVELAGQYYKDGADEVSFLNITGFHDFPLGDLPMLQVYTSENVFVPLTVGGGARDFTDGKGRHYTSLVVASEYFRSGADKTNTVDHIPDTSTKYFQGKDWEKQFGTNFSSLWEPGPNGEKYVWYQCTLVNSGREGRAIRAYELAKAVEELGAGEILLNCIDCDGQGNGFDIDLVKLVSDAVTILVIASSGAGAVEHFSEVFAKTNASAALAAGIFHRKEVPIQSVKEHLLIEGIEARIRNSSQILILKPDEDAEHICDLLANRTVDKECECSLVIFSSFVFHEFEISKASATTVEGDGSEEIDSTLDNLLILYQHLFKYS
ncbi:hypothetical protein Syun_027380 [Stephania yunnanensis]|uniref:Uncharacterized protein n=1 Tax=Stephania yunnanensis TaxID=152371 RepID=A0AAP0EPC9_9MAGN